MYLIAKTILLHKRTVGIGSFEFTAYTLVARIDY